MVNRPDLQPAEAAQAAPDSCAHHWLIESPAGETSEGVCKFCGASRSFSNYSSPQHMARGRRAKSDAAA